MMGLKVSVYGSFKCDIFVRKSFRIQLSNLSVIRQIERVGVSVIKFEVARIHMFLWLSLLFLLKLPNDSV